MNELAEKLIERKVIDALEALKIPDVKISGFWQPEPEGAVKTSNAGNAPGIAVIMALRGYTSWMSPITTLSGAISFTVSQGVSPNGSAMASVIAHVMELLRDWQASDEKVNKDLSVADVFSCDGFNLDAGAVPRFANNEWVIPLTFQIRGVMHHEQPPANH